LDELPLDGIELKAQGIVALAELFEERGFGGGLVARWGAPPGGAVGRGPPGRSVGGGAGHRPFIFEKVCVKRPGSQKADLAEGGWMNKIRGWAPCGSGSRRGQTDKRMKRRLAMRNLRISSSTCISWITSTSHSLGWNMKCGHRIQRDSLPITPFNARTAQLNGVRASFAE
jgi:hypothetical protein